MWKKMWGWNRRVILLLQYCTNVLFVYGILEVVHEYGGELPDIRVLIGMQFR